MIQPAQKQQLFTIQEAAYLLGIGPLKLFEKLRQRNILNAGNVAYPRFIRKGYFRIQRGNYWHRGIREYVPTAKTLVTLQGLNWLNNQLAEELPHGRNDQNPSFIG